VQLRLMLFLTSALSGGMREYFTVDCKATDTNYTRAWVDPKAGLDALEERWISATDRNQTMIRQSSSS